MRKIILCALLALGSLQAHGETPSKVVTCERADTGTVAVMEIFERDQGSRVRDNKLIYLKIKNQVVFDAETAVECEDVFSASGNRGDYCELGNGYTAHVHLSSYLRYSGVILYKDYRSVDDDILLECDF